MAVEFNDESQAQRQAMMYAQIQAANGPSGFESWVIKKGLAKTESQAKSILVLVACIFFALTGFILYKSLASKTPPTPKFAVPESDAGSSNFKP